MEIKDWITMLSVIALIAGWFTNSWLNRKKKLQEREIPAFVAPFVVRNTPPKIYSSIG